MFGLSAYENVIGGKTHYEFEFRNLKHTHLYVDDVVEGHKFLDFHRHGCIGIVYFDCDGSRLGCDEIGRAFVHLGYEREAWGIYGPSGGSELRIHEEGAFDGDEVVFGIGGHGPCGCLNRGGVAIAVLHIEEAGLDEGHAVSCRECGGG